jgi:hypothetical protein
MMAPDPNRWGPKAPQEITAERFTDMLNVLPPCRWHGVGELVESFHVSERLSGNVVSWFLRLGERYFQIDADATLTREELTRMVRQHIEDNRH